MRRERKRPDFTKLERGKCIKEVANATGAPPSTALSLAGMLKRPGKMVVSLEAMDKAVQDTAARLHADAVAKGRTSS